MFAGFDYGTSHCSMGIWHDAMVRLAPLENGATMVASTLYAPKPQFELANDSDGRLDMGTQTFADLRFGDAALVSYLQDPTEGYFVKSPKSFLGAPGINEEVKGRFVGVVAAMMANVKQRAEAFAGAEITQVVLGRPVNFQGSQGEAENQQALIMLREAAMQVGFSDIAFQFEPMAAALEYESRLAREETVLVVDVGGGTTDVSFVRVGPQFASSKDRNADILGHAGERVGGNDYDQALALKGIMPNFGFTDELRNGLPIPNTYFVDAISTNDVNAQQRFYSRQTAERLDYFEREAVTPERVSRLARLRSGRETYRLLRVAEDAKIALSNAEKVRADLGFVEQGLAVSVGRTEFEENAQRLLEHLSNLVSEVVFQAGQRPSAFYLTGGMSKAPMVRACVDAIRNGAPVLDSDHFASVTQGLTIWAKRLFG